MYVADVGNNRIEKFDASGNYLLSFGSAGTGAGQFEDATAVAVDNSGGANAGDVYVADQTNGVVDQFSSTGAFLGALSGSFTTPTGVAVDSSGNVWVAAAGGTVSEFSSAGAFLQSFSDGYATTSAIAVDDSGNVYLVNGQGQTEEWSSTGTFEAQIDGSDIASGVAVGSTGITFVFVDEGTYVSVYEAGGGLVSTIGQGTGTLTGATGIAFNSSTNTAYVVDQDHVQVYQEGGADVQAPSATNVGTTAATLTSQITPNGADTTYYFEYVDDADYNASAPDPYSAGKKVPVTPADIGSGTSAVTVSANLTDLTQSTTYHFRLVATSDNSTIYETDQTFTTLTPAAPSVDSESSATIGLTTATLNAQINPNNVDTTYYFEYVDDADYNASAPDPYSTGAQIPLPPGTDIGSGSSDQNATVDLTGLTESTTYHYRAVAVNSLGTIYGTDQTFTTGTPAAPSVDSESSSNLGVQTATLNAQINPNFADASYYFEYVDNADYNASAPDPYSAGTQIPLPPGTDIGDSNTDQSATVDLSALSPGTTYHFRVVARNSVGTTDGADATFTTRPNPPIIDGERASDLRPFTAMLSGAINPRGIDTQYYFEYGLSSNYGTAVPVPYGDLGAGSAARVVSQMVGGLMPGMTYHYRLDAVAAGYVTYGVDKTFVTPTLSNAERAEPPAATALEEVGLSATSYLKEAASRIVIFGNGGESGTSIIPLTFGYFYGGSESFQSTTMVVQEQMPDGSTQQATNTNFTWRPYAMTTGAEFGDGSGVKVSDSYFNSNTMLRSFSDVQAPSSGNGTIEATGQVIGTPTYLAGDRQLFESTPSIEYAIGFPSATRFYDAAGNPSAQPVAGGSWSVELAPGRGVTNVLVAVGGPAEPEANLLANLPTGAQQATANHSIRLREKAVDAVLKRVPRPQNFALAKVDAQGVTPDQVWMRYYKAWVFIDQDLLPASPECNYPYPQFPVTKGTFWPGTCTGAGYGVFFEALSDLNAYAYLDPSVAWAAYRGLLSTVQSQQQDGVGVGEIVMDGEIAPSRMAQTGLALYELTGDRSALEQVYTELKANVLWAYHNQEYYNDQCGCWPSIPGEIDTNFTAYVFNDLVSMQRIAQILNEPSEVAYWRDLTTQLLPTVEADYWPNGPSQPPNEFYVPNDPTCATEGHGVGCAGWPGMTSSLLISQELPKPYVQSLIARYADTYSPTLGPIHYELNDSKGTDVDLMFLGLMEHGQQNYAATGVDSWIRDNVLAGVFSETTSDEASTGVVPDPIGAWGMIDLVLMKNGYIWEYGLPEFYNLDNVSGSVTNIPWRGRSFSATFDGRNGTEVVTGSAVAGASCRMPVGTTSLVALDQSCLR